MSIEEGPGEGTWAVFAERVVAERDEARAERDRLRGVLRVLSGAHHASCDADEGCEACDVVDELKPDVWQWPATVSARTERDRLRESWEAAVAEADRAAAKIQELREERDAALDEVAALRIQLARDGTVKCAHCGSWQPTCFGEYETCDGSGAGYACDECCGHGNEDGWCEPIGKIVEVELPRRTEADRG